MRQAGVDRGLLIGAGLAAAPSSLLPQASRAFEAALVLGGLGLAGARVHAARRSGPRRAWAGLARWMALYGAAGLLALLFLTYPPLHRATYREFRATLVLALLLGGVLGLPAALLAGASRAGAARDVGLGLIVFLRALLRTLGGGNGRRLRRALRRRWVHAAVLQVWLLGGIFLPLAVHVLSVEHAAVALRLGSTEPASWQWGLELAVHGLRLLEAALATSALAFGAFLLGSHARSMDPTAGGWMVTLLFFYPFDSGTNALLPLPRHASALGAPWARDLVTALGLVLVALKVSATVALGPRFAYGAQRGLVRAGPYRWVRHPAYAGEYLLRWVELGPLVTSSWHLFGLVGLGVLYHLRAVTEERHLRRDPEYAEYARTVRYRYLPGLW